ncbi:MAG: hypothetical protein WEB09_07125 [Nitriliruptor sp.]
MSGADIVEDRTPEDPVVLTDLANSLLSEAESSGSGTSALSLTPTDAKAFTQTVVAVTRGNQLGAEHWNGPASVQVIVGSATVSDAQGADTELSSGQWADLTAGAGGVRADEDLVVLLTVAPA